MPDQVEGLVEQAYRGFKEGWLVTRVVSSSRWQHLKERTKKRDNVGAENTLKPGTGFLLPSTWPQAPP